MLHNTKKIQGRSLKARDGIIGEVKDVYFDDYDWTVRYLVVETGASLNQRRVLISPDVLHALDWSQQVFPVDLTMAQVRKSPDIDTNKPVSRQHEAALREYYNWPGYWAVPGGGVGLVPPMIPPTPAANPSEPGFTDGDTAPRRRGDPYLRSVHDTLGYHIEATDGDIGHVEDFLIDDMVWRIRYLVIDTRNWLPGRKVLVAPDWIGRVSWGTRRVYVSLMRDAIKAGPAYDPASSWDPDYATRLHDYYGRPRYSDWDADVTAGSPKSRRKI